MTMEQVNPPEHAWRRATDAQFTRLEEKLDRVLEGQIRIEERHAALAIKVSVHTDRLDSHSGEIGELKLVTALAGKDSLVLSKRWSAFGAVMLVAAGAVIGNVVERLFL